MEEEKNEIELVPDEENDSSALADKTKDLRERLKICEQEKANYLEGWQRAKADFINFRNDEGKRMEDMARFITMGLIQELLAVLDSFELALNHDLSKETERGVLLIKSQFEDILKKRGLSEIQVKSGDQFNTEKHESLGEIESDNSVGTIAEVVQKGYIFRDKIIRPVRVRLTK